MTASRICYRKLRTYKYQVMEDYTVKIPILPDATIDIGYIVLTTDGTLTIRKSYAWDGPSGPTIDTTTFMRGALVHDALYQLMRRNLLNESRHREAADALLKQHCLEDGMWSFRAAYVHRALRLFGKKNAMPKAGPEPQDVLYYAP